MERGVFNIADENIHTLIAKELRKGSVSFISICNAHASIGAKVRLFLDDDTIQTSILEGTVIPPGVTLQLTNIGFDNSVLALKIQIEDAAGGSTVDTNVILK